MKNKEEYISLYDYTGEATSQTGKGRDVYNAAKSKGIQVIYKDLPEERQQENYTRVATYPRSFLDEYFGKEPTPAAPLNNLTELHQRLINLETQFAQLVKRLDTLIIQEPHDDLPF